MLVEDDNSLREIYQARLMAEGYETVTAKDGEEALAIIGQEKPDLIILDIMMPKISGFDTLDILRSTPATKYTKVIIMSALSQAEDKARAEKLGANKYLVKSQVTLEDIVKTVKEVLGSDEETPGEAPKDLDMNNANLGANVAPADASSAAPATDATASTTPDIAQAQSVVDEQSQPISVEQQKIVNEETKDMNEDTSTNQPTPSDAPAPAADTSAPVTPDTSSDGGTGQVTSDPNPLSDSQPAVDAPVMPTADDSSALGDTSAMEPAVQSTTPDPSATVTPSDAPAGPDPQLVGGSKVVEPSAGSADQGSRLQELLAAEDSKEGTPAPTDGQTPPVPPAPAA